MSTEMEVCFQQVFFFNMNSAGDMAMNTNETERNKTNGNEKLEKWNRIRKLLSAENQRNLWT